MKRCVFLFSFLIYVSVYAIDPSYILITTLYNETNQARIQEFIACLKKNLQRSQIQSIHVLYDTAKDFGVCKLKTYLESLPITIHYIKGRPSYRACFELANTFDPGQRVIIANGDIYFNYTLALLAPINLTGKFVALTRWNVKDDSLVPYTYRGHPITDSQDAWIFQTPIKAFCPEDIYMGTWRCDVRTAYYAQQAGLKVLNPCRSVQCCHMHASEIRNYHTLKKTDDPYWIRVPWINILQMR